MVSNNKKTDNQDRILLDVRNLKTYFPIRAGILSRVVAHVKAVDDISFFIRQGETLGLVGESGCGKSTTGRTIIRLVDATAGQVFFDVSPELMASDEFDPEDHNLLDFPRKRMKALRRKIQMIFQDPYASLNPRMTVGSIIEEAMIIHNLYPAQERRRHVLELMDRVGLSAEQARRYPHEFSGGQRQRIGIARALAVQPKLIIADEPVSALDVSIQAQVINLMVELQQEFNLTYLFIAHDLAVVQHISDRIAVMYLGSLVELAQAGKLYESPLHPYSKALLSAVPIPDPTIRVSRTVLEGDVPNPIDKPTGCPFHTRCPEARKICTEEVPKFGKVAEDHYCACWNVPLIEDYSPVGMMKRHSEILV